LEGRQRDADAASTPSTLLFAATDAMRTWTPSRKCHRGIAGEPNPGYVMRSCRVPRSPGVFGGLTWRSGGPSRVVGERSCVPVSDGCARRRDDRIRRRDDRVRRRDGRAKVRRPCSSGETVSTPARRWGRPARGVDNSARQSGTATRRSGRSARRRDPFGGLACPPGGSSRPAAWSTFRTRGRGRHCCRTS
jgi:hypothetical protein